MSLPTKISGFFSSLLSIFCLILGFLQPPKNNFIDDKGISNESSLEVLVYLTPLTFELIKDQLQTATGVFGLKLPTEEANQVGFMCVLGDLSQLTHY